MVESVPGAVMIAYIGKDGTVIEATDMEGRPLQIKEGTQESIVGSKLTTELLSDNLGTRELTALVKKKPRCCWDNPNGPWECLPSNC